MGLGFKVGDRVFILESNFTNLLIKRWPQNFGGFFPLGVVLNPKRVSLVPKAGGAVFVDPLLFFFPPIMGVPLGRGILKKFYSQP